MLVGRSPRQLGIDLCQEVRSALAQRPQFREPVPLPHCYPFRPPPSVLRCTWVHFGSENDRCQEQNANERRQ